MADHVDLNAQPWWRRLLTLEPAVVKGVISAVVALGLVWGLDFTEVGDRVQQTADILGALVVLLSPLWIRQSVTPAALVVAKEDVKSGTVVTPEGDRAWVVVDGGDDE